LKAQGRKVVVITQNIDELHKRAGSEKIYELHGNVIIVTQLLALSAVARGFELWSSQTKYYKIGICCFSAKHAALRRKSKEWGTCLPADCCFSQL